MSYLVTNPEDKAQRWDTPEIIAVLGHWFYDVVQGAEEMTNSVDTDLVLHLPQTYLSQNSGLYQ